MQRLWSMPSLKAGFWPAVSLRAFISLFPSVVLYQMTLDFPTRSPLELAQAGFALFQQRYQWFKPVRAITIRGINLVSERQPLQLDVFCDYQRRERRRTLDDTIDDIRHRYGQGAIFSASLMGDRKLAQDKCDLVMMPGMMYS